MLSASTTKAELFRKTKFPTINLETKADQHSLEETKEEALINKEHSEDQADKEETVTTTPSTWAEKYERPYLFLHTHKEYL